MFGSAATITGIIQNVTEGLRVIVGLIFVAASIVFIWGIIQFIRASDSADAHQKARETIKWGLVGIAIMAAAWGVVTLLSNYFQVGGVGVPTPQP